MFFGKQIKQKYNLKKIQYNPKIKTIYPTIISNKIKDALTNTIIRL